jgi:DNA polymerase-3 subunit gamma/tau
MSYTVLARKYRPQTFQDLAGQEHVTRTLGNAISSGRVAHAFLFTGVRGVGKTTTARVLAKALNCKEGPTPSPCGVCDACKEITVGSDLDVQEIDGASNNSVDDVRRLQETIPFRPARDRFKIVIVDEVHMLSVGAFNAFLKTLEEPPPHVKFIFATTESHKVPITIRSRCQRYDFRLIPQSVVAERVRTILAAEGFEADEDAIAIVSREAAGSMRDALTLLDQIVAFSGAKLVGKEVATVLGIADRELLHRTAAALLAGDGAMVLDAIDQLASRGLDLLHFARGLVDLLRDVVVLRVSGKDTELVALVEEERQRAIALAGDTEPLEVQRAFHAASQLVDEMAKSTLPRTTLEMGLVRIATRPPLRSLAELVARLEAVERKTPPGGGAPGGGRAPSGGGGPARPRSSGGFSAMPGVPSAPIATPAAIHGGPSTPAPITTQTSPPPVARIATERAPSERKPSVAPPESAPVEPRRSAPIAEPTRAIEPQAVRAEPSAASREAMGAWEPIVIALGGTRPALGAVLGHAIPQVVTGERLVIAFPKGSFYAKQAESAESQAAIVDIAERRLGGRPKLEIVELSASAADTPTIAKLEEERRRARLDATRKKALNHPIVVEALSVFDAKDRAVEVRIDGE